MTNYYIKLNDYLDYFKKEFGERKYYKIEKKIYNSTKVSKLIQIAKQRMVIPNHNDYVPMLHEIPYFIFANRDTIALGTVLTMERWNIECNSYQQLASDSELYFILNNIFDEVGQL